MDRQLLPGRYLLGDELTVLDLCAAVASRFGPWRERFTQVAPGMLAALWQERFSQD